MHKLVNKKFDSYLNENLQRFKWNKYSRENPPKLLRNINIR